MLVWPGPRASGGVLAFFVARFARLYPLYIAVLLGGTLMFRQFRGTGRQTRADADGPALPHSWHPELRANMGWRCAARVQLISRRCRGRSAQSSSLTCSSFPLIAPTLIFAASRMRPWIVAGLRGGPADPDHPPYGPRLAAECTRRGRGPEFIHLYDQLVAPLHLPLRPHLRIHCRCRNCRNCICAMATDPSALLARSGTAIFYAALAGFALLHWSLWTRRKFGF